VNPDFERLVRAVTDFPQPGVLYRDVTPLLADAVGFRASVDALIEAVQPLAVDVVAGIESRGFLWAAPVALALGAGVVPVRKRGKLPRATIDQEYTLEYGISAVEVHADALQPGQRVLVVDDVLATGGTASATVRLIQRLGAVVTAVAVLIELEALGGRGELSGADVRSLIRY
jgi:adenine phosphoribosyltransferase